MKKQEWANSNINDVVASGLCTRCGACYGACPYGAIEWDENFFPHTNTNCQECNICVTVCGGIGFDYPKFAKEHYGHVPNFLSDAIGTVKYSVAAFSTDQYTRSISSSGGLASQILISLLEADRIDGAVVTGFEPERPLQPIAKIATNRDEVIWGAQSKYVLFPVAHIYREIIERPGRYAVVGLPCQLHSLVKWQSINSRLRERVILTVGLCCHANLEIQMLKDLLAVKRISPKDVKKLEFRGGEWPGGIRVTLGDGRIKPLHDGGIKDGAFNYLKSLYMAKRCLICPDYSAEFADISISDPWIRGANGNYIFKGGWSVAHVRTQRGDNILSEMKSANEIVVTPVDHHLLVENNRSITAHKKRGVFIRLRRLQKRRMSHPEYQLLTPTLGLKDYWQEFRFQLTQLGSHFAWLRILLLRLAFSNFGGKIKQLRAYTKKLKYRWLS